MPPLELPKALLVVNLGLRLTEEDYLHVSRYAQAWRCTPAQAVRRLLRHVFAERDHGRQGPGQTALAEAVAEAID